MVYSTVDLFQNGQTMYFPNYSTIYGFPFSERTVGIIPISLGFVKIILPRDVLNSHTVGFRLNTDIKGMYRRFAVRLFNKTFTLNNMAPIASNPILFLHHSICLLVPNQ